LSTSGVEIVGLPWLHGTDERIGGHGAVADVTVIPWEEAALANPSRFADELRTLGLRVEDIDASVDLAASGKAEADTAVSNFWATRGHNFFEDPADPARAKQIYNSAQASGLSKLRNWWKDRNICIQVEERTEVSLQLPLFLISAPGIPGCSATFTTESFEGHGFGWSVTIMGTGLGADSSVQASASATFKAASGETKVVFLPATVFVEKITVLDRGAPIYNGYRIDVAGIHKQNYAPAVMLLDANSLPPLGRKDKDYQLGGDTSGGITTYKHTYMRTKKPFKRLGIKTHGVELELSVQSEMSKRKELVYDLRGGYDYVLHRVADWDGLLWAEPKIRAAT